MDKSKLKTTLEVLASSFIISIELFLAILFMSVFISRGRVEYAVVSFSLLLLFTYPTLKLIQENRSHVFEQKTQPIQPQKMLSRP